MKENKINWWLIIGIVVVVAVITALVTMQVTGEVVSVTNTDKTACISSCVADSCTGLTRTSLTKCKSSCSSSCSKVEVYTKDEVDALYEEMYTKLVNHARDVAKEEILLYHTDFSCTDSDGGKNTLVAGYVFGNNKSSQEIVNVSDYCSGANSLWEYYCDDQGVSKEYMICPDGCSMGVCLNESNLCRIINTTTRTCNFEGTDYTITAKGCSSVPVDIRYSGITESYQMYSSGTSSDPTHVHQAVLRNGVKITLISDSCAVQYYTFMFETP